MNNKLTIDLDFLRRLNGNASAVVVYSYLTKCLNEEIESRKETIEKNNMWFRCPFGDVSEKLKLNEYKLRSVIKILVQNDLIEYTNKGLPKTMWIKILN